MEWQERIREGWADEGDLVAEVARRTNEILRLEQQREKIQRIIGEIPFPGVREAALRAFGIEATVDPEREAARAIAAGSRQPIPLLGLPSRTELARVGLTQLEFARGQIPISEERQARQAVISELKRIAEILHRMERAENGLAA
jgi:hypothetical protein